MASASTSRSRLRAVPSRMPAARSRAWSAGVVVAILCSLLASCQSHGGPAAIAPAGANSVPSAAATASGNQSSPADAVPLTGPAITAFGRPKVQAAYQQMLAFTFHNGWNPTLILTHADAIRGADFAEVLSAMTPECAATFTTAFGKVEKHDKAAIRTLEAAIFFGVIGPKGMRPLRSASMVSRRRYGQATLGVQHASGIDQLALSFSAQADIAMQDQAGKNAILPTSRTVRFLLTPNHGSNAATVPFLISSWKATMTAQQLTPVG